MSLRTKILTHSLPLLPTHSFTRQTLSLALSHLPREHPDHKPEPISDSVLDTLFGDGSSASKALVERWDEEGLQRVEVESEASSSSTRLKSRLGSRLSYSAEIGEHLVEAYSLLSAPKSATSIPIPAIPLAVRQLLSLRLPPIYTPPGLAARGALSMGDMLSGVAGRTGGRLPLPVVNPLGPVSYAWRIVDAAIRAEERIEGIKRGVMNEPVGAGPEWYTTRISLALAYLQAESHLLKPYPSLPPDQVYADRQPNPHLGSALQALERNMQLYRNTRSTVDDVEKGAGSAGGYLDFVARSMRGLIKSRYL